MARGVSEEHISGIVCEERLKKLKEFTERLGTYDIIAVYKFLKMRRNVISVENSQSFHVGSYAKVFDVESGVEYSGKISEINGPKAKLDVDGTVFIVSSDMLYE